MDWLKSITQGAGGLAAGLINRAQSPTRPQAPQTNNSVSNVMQNVTQGTNRPAGGPGALPAGALVRSLQSVVTPQRSYGDPAQNPGAPTPPPTNPPPATDPYAAERAAAAAAQAEAEARQRAQWNNELGARNTELGTLAPTRDRNLSSIDARLGSILGGYDADKARNTADFQTQTDTARGNYDRNLQSSLSNAARGRQGLLSTLASLGALSGSGLTLADRAVQQGANLDIAGANDTLRDNTTSLNRSFDEFTRQDEQRRRQAEDEASGLRNTSQYNYFNDLANLLTQISNIQGNLGNTDAMNSTASQLQGALGERANYAVSPVAGISQQGAAYTPSALSSFQSTAPDVTISAAPEGQNINALLPSLMANIRRRQQQGV